MAEISGKGSAKLVVKVARGTHDIKNALTSFEKANDLSGEGLTYLSVNDLNKAQENFAKANDSDGLGKIFLKQRQYDKAIKYFSQTNDYDAMGDVFFALKEYDKAAEAFEKANNPAKAVQALSQKMSFDPKKNEWVQSGLDEAIVFAQKKLAENVSSLPLHMEMGKIYVEKGDFKSAQAEFTYVTESTSYLKAEALYQIGRLYYKQGDYSQALTTFKKLCAAYPGTKVAEDAQKSIDLLGDLQNTASTQQNTGDSAQSNEVAEPQKQALQLTDANRCGPMALQKIFQLQKISSTPNEIAKLAGTNEKGTTASGLCLVARNKGLIAEGLEVSFNELKKLGQKAIVVLNGRHYVVIDHITSDTVFVYDNLKERKILKLEFLKIWNNKAIVVSKSSADLVKIEDKRTLSTSELHQIVAGDMRSTGDGGWTKNDPGVFPDGSWDVDYTNLGPIVPVEVLSVQPSLMPNMRPKGGMAPNLTPQLSTPQAKTVSRKRVWLGGNGTCEAPHDPIAITGGQLILPFRDIDVPVIGKESGLYLRFERTYNSRSVYQGPLGFGWQLYHNAALTDSGLAVNIKGPDGTTFTYNAISPALPDGSINYQASICDGSSLIKFPDGTYKWTRWTSLYGNQYYQFNANKQLIYIQGRNNTKLTYSYSGSLLTQIADNSGRTLKFGYDANNRIISVTDPANRIFKFAYDSNNNLTQATDPLNQITVYQYSDPGDIHNMTAIIDPMGNKTSYAYDNSNDSVVKVTDALGKVTTYVYDFNLGITRVTDPKMNVTTFQFSDAHINKVTDALGGQTSYTYDSRRMRNGITDRNGNITTWVNDLYGNPSLIDGALAGTADRISLTYDPIYHNAVTIQDALGRVHTYSYDGQGNLVSQSDPVANVVNYTYDALGQLKTLTDPKGNVTNYQYDTYGNLIKIIDPEGFINSYTYDSLGNILTETDPLNNVTTYQYDLLNRLIKKTNADGSFEQYAYDKNSNITAITNTQGKSISYVYDSRGRLVSITDPLGQKTTVLRDDVGNIIKVTDPKNNITQYGYDVFGRVTSLTDPEGAVTVFNYQGTNAPLPVLNAPISIRDAHGHITSFVYDNLYRLVQSTDALGKQTSYSYDAIGNLLWVRDPNGYMTTYTYDNLNRRISLINSSGLKTTFTYDKNGNLASKIDPNNQTITYSYNKNDLLIKKTYPNASFVSFAYNGVGKPISMVDATGTTTYSYDKLYRVLQVVAPGTNNTMKYTYDTEGNRLTMVNQDNGLTTYAYDVLNRIISITNPLNQITQYQYDSVGNIVKTIGANGVSTTHTYNKRNQVLAIQTQNAALQLLASSTSSYDSAGLLLNITQENGDKTSYTYDAIHQLTSEIKKNVGGSTIYSYAYTYDPVKNRLSMNKNGVITNYTYNNLNQLKQSITAGVTNYYNYNNNGSLTSSIEAGKTTTYAYDYEDRLTKITYSDATTSSFVYSADDRRVKTTEGATITNYLHDGMLPVIERNGSNVTQVTYTNGVGLDGGIGGLISQSTAIGTHWYQYVHNGISNVSHLTNATGSVVAKYNYEAFGNVVAQSGTITNSRQFQTKEINTKSNLIYFGKRWYNPVIGRWTTPDPLEMVDGPNLYAYLNNNPINYIDPWGLCVAGGNIWGWIGRALDVISNILIFADFVDPVAPGPTGEGIVPALAIKAAKTKLVVIGKSMPKVIEKAAELRKVGIDAKALNLKNLGSPKANYYQNMSKLREALREGRVPYDMQNGSKGFLGTERNLLRNRGLNLNKQTGLWE